MLLFHNTGYFESKYRVNKPVRAVDGGVCYRVCYFAFRTNDGGVTQRANGRDAASERVKEK